MKKQKFADLDNPLMFQTSLFLPPGVSAHTKDPFPPISHTAQGMREVLEDTSDGLGLDLEFDFKAGRWYPTILGIASRRRAAAIRWDESMARTVLDYATTRNISIIGHSVISADKPVLDQALNVETPLAMWEDTLCAHYLNNPDFTKSASGKEVDAGEGDGGGMGLMNLWTMASLYTDVPQWKQCRGKACEGPCPLHQFPAYCAMDAWAGLESHYHIHAQLKEKGVPYTFYRDLVELTDVCERMKAQGVAVDWAYVDEMEKNFEERKLEIFPVESVNGKPHYTLFNPKSAKQVQDYFAKFNIPMEKTDKKAVRKALEREAKKAHLDVAELEHAEELPENLDALFRLYQFKSAGKGLTSWFNDKYKGSDGLIHPRFISVGASTGRLSSSGPNFQNIPARGFGALVRRAVVPRSPDFDFVKADYRNLELRMCLFLAGVDPTTIDKDAFMWLVRQADGAFDKAAEIMADSPRQVAKSVMHAYNYMEGVTVLTGRDLATTRIQSEIRSGALQVWLKQYGAPFDWEFRNGVIAFTGANLAERLFKTKTYENRKKALDLQNIVNKGFPMLREWQRRVLDSVQDSGFIRTPTGHVVPLYGTAEEDAKMATAILGQGTSGHFVQEKMLRMWREERKLPLLMVHDELDWEVPREWSDKQVVDYLQVMIDPAHRDGIDGFVSAVKIQRGRHWLEESKDTAHIEGVLRTIYS